MERTQRSFGRFVNLTHTEPKTCIRWGLFRIGQSVEKSKANATSNICEKSESSSQVIAKDSNVPVVLVAAKCLTSLAKGLRKGFKTHAVGVSVFLVLKLTCHCHGYPFRCWKFALIGFERRKPMSLKRCGKHAKRRIHR
jgi:hypothetical protein